MSVKIRLKRVGGKNDPAFRLVVTDSRSPRDGRFIEELGTYQPTRPGQNYTVNLDRANYWVSRGAQPSDTVASLLKRATRAQAASAA
jgi:small subunit ribosomal protein S16